MMQTTTEQETAASEFHGPGIIGLMMSRPALAHLYSRITDMLLCGPKPGTDGPGSALPRAFRERMAAAVSRANECAFCEESHCAVAQVVTEREGALDMPWGKRVALMMLAIEVTKAPSADQKAAVARAMRDATEHAGATSDEIHDTVLIAAWFSFLNRYVSAMNPAPYGGIEQYLAPAQMLAEAGYEATLDAMVPGPAPGAPGGPCEECDPSFGCFSEPTKCCRKPQASLAPAPRMLNDDPEGGEQ